MFNKTDSRPKSSSTCRMHVPIQKKSGKTLASRKIACVRMWQTLRMKLDAVKRLSQCVAPLVYDAALQNSKF